MWRADVASGGTVPEASAGELALAAEVKSSLNACASDGVCVSGVVWNGS